jgi:hypothetical protein
VSFKSCAGIRGNPTSPSSLEARLPQLVPQASQ